MNKKYNLIEIIKESNNILLYNLSLEQFFIIREACKKIAKKINVVKNYEEYDYKSKDFFYQFQYQASNFINGKSIFLNNIEIIENVSYKMVKFDDIDLDYFLDDTLLPKKWAIVRTFNNCGRLNNFINLAYANCNIKKNLSSTSAYKNNFLNTHDVVHFSGNPNGKDTIIKSYIMDGYTKISDETFLKYFDYLYNKYVTSDKIFHDYMVERFKKGSDVVLQDKFSKQYIKINNNTFPKNVRLKKINLDKYNLINKFS